MHRVLSAVLSGRRHDIAQSNQRTLMVNVGSGAASVGLGAASVRDSGADGRRFMMAPGLSHGPLSQ